MVGYTPLFTGVFSKANEGDIFCKVEVENASYLNQDSLREYAILYVHIDTTYSLCVFMEAYDVI